VTPGAAILVIVVATGGAREPATVALLSAVEEAIGASVSIRVEEIGDPGDAGALRVERDLRAAAVATLSWRDAGHLGATIRLHTARTDAWTNRTIAFSPQDATAERGRTLGLVVAALWIAAQPGAPAAAAPDAAPPSNSTTAPTGTPPQTAPPPEPPASAAPPSPKPADEKPPATLTARAPAVARPAAPSGARGRFAIGAAAVGALGVEGPASALGGAIEGLAFVSKRLALRVGASGRTGPLPELPGSDTVGTAGAGVEAWLFDPDATFRLGARIDALAIVHRVRADPEAEVHSRWLPGGDLRLQSAVRMADHADWLIGVGVEAAPGATDIRRGSNLATVATIPALRLLAETGLRWIF